MPTYTRSSFPDAVFGTRPDGSIVAVNFYIEPITYMLVAAAYIQWCWNGTLDDGFTYIGGWSVESSDAQAVEDIMRSGGHWDASWENLKNGTLDYTSPRDGSVHSGSDAISRRMADWLIVNNVMNDEIATDQQWMPAFMATQQTELDTRLLAAPKPPKPGPRPPSWQQWHPQQVGQIADALNLDMAQSTRLTLVADPANPNRMVFGKIPVPQ